MGPASTTCTTQQGQSPWLDNLKRGWITERRARALGRPRRPGHHLEPVDLPEGHRGGRPTTTSSSRDAGRRRARRSRTPTGTCVTTDIRDALGILRPVYDASDGVDGFVSVEVAPGAGPRHRRHASSAARHLHDHASPQPNLYVKIPGTAEGLPAIQQMIAEGRSINVTLLFRLERYAEVIEAYLAGLEAAEGDLSAGLVGGLVLRQPGRHRGRPPPRRDRHRRGARPAGQGRGRQRPARLPAVPRALLRPPLGGARRPGRPGAAAAVGVDLHQEPATTPTRSTSTRSSGPTRSTRCPTPRSRRSTTTAPWPAPSTPTSTAARRRARRGSAEVGVDLADVTRVLEDEGVAVVQQVASTSCSACSAPRPPASAPERPAASGPDRRRAVRRHERVARRRRRRARRVRRAGHRGVPRPPARHVLARAVRRRHRPRAATSAWPTTAGTQIDWWKVDVYWGDERCVPLDDPDSNYRLAREALLDRVGAANATFPMRCAEGPDPYQLRLGELGRVRPRPPRPRARRPHRVAVPRVRRARRRPRPARRA